MHFSKAINLRPNFTEAYYHRGLAYHSRADVNDNKKDDYDRAIKDFTKAIELKPDYANAYINHGLDYKNIGEIDRAIADHSRAIVLKPDDADAYFNRGDAYRCKDEYGWLPQSWA